MAPQKTMQLLRKFSPNPLSGGNLIGARFAQTTDRAKFSKQNVLTVLTYTRAIIENTFVNSLLEQQLMIRVCEPVCLIADPLQQMQSAGIDRQLYRHGPAGPVNFFMFFRQTDDR